jgi:hypothetical protein
MDSQQMMELLLALNEKMDAYTKAMIKKMDANTEAMLATQEMAEEIKEANRASSTKVMENERMKANIDACIADRKEMTACQDAMEANLVKMGPAPKTGRYGKQRRGRWESHRTAVREASRRIVCCVT